MSYDPFDRYLIRARQDLRSALEHLPTEYLSRQVLSGKRFACIKDLLMHIADVEDSWLHGDILKDAPVFTRVLPKEFCIGEVFFADVPLETVFDYWQAVQQSTLAYLESEPDLSFMVDVNDKQQQTAHSLIFMLHEVRHTAQIVFLLRRLGHKPPALDLLWYLPPE
ncbi:MAG: DinB family protein [Deinococcales bacterium]